MRRPINQKEKALLDEMSRSNDPTIEARQHLEFELETSVIARRAFVAELVRLRHFVATARSCKRGLAPTVRYALDELARVKNFDHLVALAEGRGEEAPAPELEPGSSG